MYANISRSGTSSASTPQKPTQLQQFPQNLSLPGSAEMAEGRPSTRRGGRPGSQSQSGGSADGSGPTMAENDRHDQPNVGIYERRGTVDVWTRDQSARMHKNGENDGSEDSPKSTSTKSKGTSITNGLIKKKKSSISSQTSAENEGNNDRRQSYPELSEPGNYSSEQFEESEEEEEEDDEEENEGDEGHKNGHEGNVDDFSRKLREMASAAIRNRSLHESLQSSIQRGADATRGTVKSPPSQSALPPSIGANRPGTGSRRSSKGSSAGGTVESREGTNGSGERPKWTPPIPMPRHIGGSSAGLKANEEEDKRELAQGSSTSNSSAGAGSTGTRVVESSMKGHSEVAHSNGFLHQNEANNANAKHLAINNGHSKGIDEGIGGDGQRMKNEHLKQSTQIGMAESIPNNQKPSFMPQRLSVSRDGQRPAQRSAASGFQEIGKVPLGFGSSSASGRATKPTMPNKGPNGEIRGRSASVSAIRNEENTAGYRGWLRQKLAEEKAKKEREAEKKEQEEKNKKEKRELAEKNFAHWKVEMDRKMAERKERERRMIEQKAKKEREEKDEKLTNAQRTFVYWKKTRDERSRAQKERSRSAEQRKREEIERKKEEKRREAEAAFQAWIQEADDRKRAREEMKEEEKAKKEIEKEKHGEMRKQIAQEAYGLWIHMKEEERKYKQSLAYRILDFERKSNTFIAPWIPTSPSTMAKLNRPPPELVQGRRRTLEKRLILPHSRPSHSAKSAKRMDGNGQQGGGGGGRQAKSAVGSRRPWR